MAAVAVTSGTGRWAAVSDGTRSPFPLAVSPGAWGSPAAETLLGGERRLGFHDDDVDLYAWACDPFDSLFLAGLARRVSGHLALPALGASPELGCALSVPVSPVANGEPSDHYPPGDPEAALAGAGFPRPVLVDPADAVLCRALAAPDGRQAFAGAAVTVVACGERWTVVRRYELERHGGRTEPRRGPSAALAVGSRLWSTEMALRVLRQREEVPARAVLAVLWGLYEYAAMLRLAPPETLVPWSGPVPSPAFAPLRFSTSACLRWPAVSHFVDAVRGASRDQGYARDQVVVGGIGAIWPFVDAAFPGDGPPPWRSSAPELDLAVGAAYYGVDAAGGATSWARSTNPGPLRARMLAGHSTPVPEYSSAPAIEAPAVAPAELPVVAGDHPADREPSVDELAGSRPAGDDDGSSTVEVPPSERRSW
jgi:hypothetical protein